MFRNKFYILLLVVSVAQAASAENWANKLFKVKSHNFGTVARNAKTQFSFEVTNPYVADIHISGVRASCGCTTPLVTKDTLKTYEKGEIIAVYNTDRFLGKRGATLTVTIDKPYYAEVQLRVSGYIRSDITVEPSSIDFGPLAKGSELEKRARISYHGGGSWQLTNVEKTSEHLDASILPVPNRSGVYDLVVRLKPTAPVGAIFDELKLVSTDRTATRMPLLVQGNVRSSVSVSPASLFLGVVPLGQEASGRLIVKGKTPFKITGIKSSNDAIAFTVPDKTRRLHVLPLTFTADNAPHKMNATIEIQTDMDGGSATTCEIFAAVVESAASK